LYFVDLTWPTRVPDRKIGTAGRAYEAAEPRRVVAHDCFARFAAER
jgi:hypothetical protein